MKNQKIRRQKEQSQQKEQQQQSIQQIPHSDENNNNNRQNVQLSDYDPGLSFQYQSPRIVKRLNTHQQSQLNPYMVFQDGKSSDRSLFYRKTEPRIKPSDIVSKILREREHCFEQSEQHTPPKRQKRIRKYYKPSNFVISKQSAIEQRQASLGQLLLFSPKNKTQSLVYVPSKQTAVSIPICKKCRKIFQNYSGLGGHWRACRKQTQIHP